MNLILPWILLLSASFQDGLGGDKAAALFPISGRNQNKQLRYGFMDATGQRVVDFQYEAVRPFSEGLAAVKTGIGWGFIDPKGTIVVPDTFDAVGSYFEGLASFKIQKEAKWGYIDRQGSVVIPAQYGTPFRCSDGLIRFKDDKTGRFGFMNKSGVVVIPASWSVAEDFSEGLAVVDRGTYIDQKGAVAFRTNGEGKSFSEGLAALTTSSGAGYYLDKKGSVVIGAAAKADATGVIQLNSRSRKGADFWGGERFSDGLALAKSTATETYGFLDHQGKFAIAPRYYPATSFSEGLAFVEWKDSGTSSRGYIDKTGQVVIPIEFGWKCDPFRGGLAHIVREMGGGNLERYIDKTGKVVWER